MNVLLVSSVDGKTKWQNVTIQFPYKQSKSFSASSWLEVCIHLTVSPKVIAVVKLFVAYFALVYRVYRAVDSQSMSFQIEPGMKESDDQD